MHLCLHVKALRVLAHTLLMQYDCTPEIGLTRLAALYPYWQLYVSFTNKKRGLTKICCVNPQSRSTRSLAVWQYALMNAGPWWKANLKASRNQFGHATTIMEGEVGFLLLIYSSKKFFLVPPPTPPCNFMAIHSNFLIPRSAQKFF